MSISLVRQCPGCRSQFVSKGGRHCYACDGCGHCFAGFRIGPIRLAYSRSSDESTAQWGPLADQHVLRGRCGDVSAMIDLFSRYKAPA